MQWLCQPTKDLLITRILISSVVRASEQRLEGRGSNSYLELRIFFVFFSLLISFKLLVALFPLRFPMMNVGMNPFLGQQVSCVNNLSSALCVLHFQVISQIECTVWANLLPGFITWQHQLCQQNFVSNCSLFLSCSL